MPLREVTPLRRSAEVSVEMVGVGYTENWGCMDEEGHFSGSAQGQGRGRAKHDDYVRRVPGAG